MKGHHATLLAILGIITLIFMANVAFENSTPEPQGFVVTDETETEAIACCSVGEKTCYAFDGSCTYCDALCN